MEESNERDGEDSENPISDDLETPSFQTPNPPPPPPPPLSLPIFLSGKEYPNSKTFGFL
jgi:hypothetical protein